MPQADVQSATDILDAPPGTVIPVVRARPVVPSLYPMSAQQQHNSNFGIIECTWDSTRNLLKEIIGIEILVMQNSSYNIDN